MASFNLINFFQEEFFLPQLVSQTKEELLEELVQVLYDKKKVKSKSLILETLLKRETLGSTGIGKRVAVPHCRTLVVSEVTIMVGISPLGIPYDSIDKKDVKLFFLIVAPPQEESNFYLPILGKIVELLRDSRIRKSLMKVKDFSSFLNIIQRG